MLTLAMRRTSRDFTPVSSSDIADDDENTEAAVPVGDSPAYQQLRRQQRQSRDPTIVTSAASSASADNSQRLQIVSTSRGEEFVDISQVQQLLLENAGVGSVSSVGVSGRGGVLGHLHRTAAEYPHLGLEAAVRGRMLLESSTTVPAIPTPSHRHYHHPPQTQSPPPYYYANYVQQQEQQQHQTSSVEDLFALWLGSSGAGRSFLF